MKPAFCICENKNADQLRSNCAADQRLCFSYTDSAMWVNPSNCTQYSAGVREYSVRRGMVRSIQHLRLIVRVFIKFRMYI